MKEPRTEREAYLADYLIISVHLPPKSCPLNQPLQSKKNDPLHHVPCVWGFLTSISRKLSGTLYISSIYPTHSITHCYSKSCLEWMRTLTVCSLPDILGSPKPFPARAKGETAVILAVVVVVCWRLQGRWTTIAHGRESDHGSSSERSIYKLPETRHPALYITDTRRMWAFKKQAVEYDIRMWV